MRRSLATALLSVTLLGGDAAAQILDDTLVPRGRLRLQAHPTFTGWDSRFGRMADGSEGREQLGIDLTDPTGASLFPGYATLVGHVQDITGSSGYAPAVGAARGRVSQDISRVDFGGHLGVFDWLTLGVVVPWLHSRTALDLTLAPDTAGGGALGLNPTVTDQVAVDAYLGGLGAANTAARANAVSACAGGPGPECSAAQALADRAATLLGSAQGAYGASALFPMAGSPEAASLGQVSSMLDADLVAAGLPAVGAPMAFATDPVTGSDVLGLPALAASGIAGTPLGSRRGLWQTGDIEVSALARLLERVPEEADGLAYRLTVGVLVRLPTGAPEDPDVFLDVGTGDGQTDYEARATALLTRGSLGMAIGGRYGVQSSTALTKRVAPPEVAMPPVGTRAELRFEPAPYFQLETAPFLRVGASLSITGHVRYFQKSRDVYRLVDPGLTLNPDVLSVESGAKLTQVGGGLRYSTVDRWRAGEASRPLEIHVRVVHAVAGSGGQVPVTTRVEAGLRLFRRFWGEEPTR